MSKRRSLGVVLTKLKSGSEPTDLVIRNLTNIGELGLEAEEIEVTTLDDDGKVFIGGGLDAGELTFSGYTDDDHETDLEALYALVQSQSVEDFTLVFPSGSKWEFEAYVKMFKEAESEVNGVRGFTGSLRITGIPRFTKATPSA